MGKATKQRQPIKFSAFEDEIHLSEFIDFDLEYHAGALVLQKDLKGKHIFRFGFETSGIHSCLEEKRFLQAFSKLEKGIKALPFAENITISVSSFSESKNRIHQLNTLLAKNDNPGIRLLLESEVEKVEELRKRGVRQPKILRVYVTYTPDRTYERHGKGWQDSFFESLFGKVKSATAKLDKKQTERRNKELFTKVYQSGFLSWRRHLQERMGLSVKPMTADQLWAELWDEFSDEPVPEIPQVIRVTKDAYDTSGCGIKYDIESNNSVSAATLLTKSGTPVDDDKWIKIKGRYVGCLTFVNKPAGWASERDQLSYLWNVLNRDDAGDMKIVCQISVDSEKAARKNLQRFNAQSTAKQKASKKGSDRMAVLKQDEAEEAEDKVLAGNIPLSVAVGLQVYRDNVRQLEEACANVSAQFYAPAWVAREEKIAWKIWSQCLPTCADELLAKAMYNRRLVYATDEAMGFTPVFTTGSSDIDGVELLAEDGSSVFINLFDFGKPLNMALFASTRSGKSVLVAAFLLHALSNDVPIIAMDYPQGDGLSTFYDFTKIMGDDGAYYNIANECSNICHQPDLSKVNPEKREAHQAQFVSSLKHIILSLIGQSGDNALDDDAKTILMPLVSEFIDSDEVQQRFADANRDGPGSEAWNSCPTLHDLKAFVTTKDDSPSNQRALDYIHRKLNYWLKSDIANAIAKPSTFREDTKLIVFALTNVSDPADAAILGLAAYSAAIRKSLSYDASIFFIDESPILFQFPMISQLIANLTANFGKSGGRVILTAQTVTAIAQCGHAAQILGNCKVKLVGCIESGQEESFEENLKMDSAQANDCSSEDFIRNKGDDWSNWMLSYGGKWYRARFFPGKKLLRVVANNRDEQKTREFFMKHFPVEYALDATDAHLANCIKKGVNPLEHFPPIEQIESARAYLEQQFTNDVNLAETSKIN